MLASRICPLLPITDTHAKMPSHTYTSKREGLETVHVPVAATAHPPNVWELKKNKNNLHPAVINEVGDIYQTL